MRIRHLVSVVVVLIVALGGFGLFILARAQTSDAQIVSELLADPVADEGPVEAIPSPHARSTTPPPTAGPLPTASPTPPVAASGVEQDGLVALTFPQVTPESRGATAKEPPLQPLDVELRRRLELIAAFPDVQIDSPFGIAVVDGWGRDVFTLGADQPLLPASTNKLVVAAAAIQTFGPNQRFTTAVATTAPVDGNGVVEGDLVLIGGGDPALASPRFITEIYPARPHTPIAELVKAVQDAGITGVSGGVIAVPDIFARQLEPQGWVSSYYDRLEGTRTSGLTVDAGRRLFVRESDDALLGAAAKDPAVEAATVLRQLLIDAEIDVAGEPSLLETGVEPDVEVIGTVNSPPLSQMLSHMVKRSDNNMADTLFRLMGAIDSDGTWSGSSRAVRRALAPLELDWTGIALSDGSGLSRTDRLTASFLAHLDEAMMSTADADRWRALMAIAGESGTLRDRYRGTPAAGNMFGKTGALKDVRALAGSVDAPAPEGTTVAPERLHFAIVGSELDGKDIDRFRRLIDLLVLTLAAEEQGCDGWQAGGPDEDVQPESLVCAA